MAIAGLCSSLWLFCIPALTTRCRWIWLQQHILWHHPHTNNAELDGDATSAEPLLLFHNYPNASRVRKVMHRFQHWYMHLILAFYGPSVVWNLQYMKNQVRQSAMMPDSMFNKGQFLPTQLTPMVLFRLFYALRVVIAPWCQASGTITSTDHESCGLVGCLEECHFFWHFCLCQLCAGHA